MKKVVFVFLLIFSHFLNGQSIQKFSYIVDEQKFEGMYEYSLKVKEKDGTKVLDITSTPNIELDNFESPILIFKIKNLTFPSHKGASMKIKRNTNELPGLTASSSDNGARILEREEVSFSYAVKELDPNEKDVVGNIKVFGAEIILPSGDEVEAKLGGTTKREYEYKIIPARKKMELRKKEEEERKRKEEEERKAKEKADLAAKSIAEQKVAEAKKASEEVAIKAAEAKKAKEKAEAEEKIASLAKKARQDSIDAVEAANKHAKEAEESAWSAAVASNSVESYKAFLGKYATSVYASKARENIQVAEKIAGDDKLWDEVKNSKTSQAFERYLSKYPNGKHFAEAKEVKAKLEEEMKGKDPDEETWKTISKTNFDQLKGYLTDFAEGKHKTEAFAALKGIPISATPQDSVSSAGDSTVYRIDFSHVWGKKLNTKIEGGKEWKQEGGDGKIALFVKVKMGENITIIPVDELGRTIKSEKIEFKQGEKGLTGMIANQKNKNGNIEFNLFGGTPPYTLQFRVGEVTRLERNFSTPPFEISLSELEAGEYQIFLLDAKKTVESPLGKFEKKEEKGYGLLIGAGVLIVLLLLLAWWFKNKNSNYSSGAGKRSY